MSIAAAHHWQQNAACLGLDVELFFPEERGGQATANQAKQVCAGCPVKAECLNYALEERIGHGIWGGMDINERQKLSDGRRRFPRPIRHGTNGGSRAHQRRGEEPCADCKRAHALYHQMLLEKNRGEGI